jgi:hypothetical protein
MKLEKWSWFAGIVAAIVAILAKQFDIPRRVAAAF